MRRADVFAAELGALAVYIFAEDMVFTLSCIQCDMVRGPVNSCVAVMLKPNALQKQWA
jgi:hypothetical protein